MRFQNRVALVTGAGQGIGRATALRFAQEGARIAVADINITTAETVAQEIIDSGGQAIAIQADVSDSEQTVAMVDTAVSHFSALHILFSNAGIGGGDLVANLDPQQWDQVVNVNLRGVFLSCKAAIPALIESGGGAIVNMASSMAGWDTSLHGAAYMASKEGVLGLTKSLALQLGGYGIRVNAICPGVIKTRLGFKAGMSEKEWEEKYEKFSRRIPLRRVGLPEDVAAAVAFLASDQARHITGSSLLIDGGQTLQSWSNAPAADEYPIA